MQALLYCTAQILVAENLGETNVIHQTFTPAKFQFFHRGPDGLAGNDLHTGVFQ